MSTAQVTEAHRKLADEIIFATDYCSVSPQAAAKLIADSEARAVLKETGYLKAMVQDGTNAMKERDQLRAEVGWWKNQHAENQELEDAIAAKVKGTIDALRAEVERLKADGAASAFIDMSCRASHAEAELATAKERLRSEAMDDYSSIKNLQRELAAERARLDWLEKRAPKCWGLIDAQMLAGKTETIRAAIDAAMKEAAK